MYALVSAMPAGTYSTYAKTIIQPVRKPPVRPSPRLLYVYSEPADGSRRANSAMLLAQHMDAANAMSTTSGDANPAYDTTMTSPATTEPAGATLLAPNAITRADPTTPRASPASVLSVPMPRPSARSPHRSLTGPVPWRRGNSGDRAQRRVQLGQVDCAGRTRSARCRCCGSPSGLTPPWPRAVSSPGATGSSGWPRPRRSRLAPARRDESCGPVSSPCYGSYQP